MSSLCSGPCHLGGGFKSPPCGWEVSWGLPWRAARLVVGGPLRGRIPVGRALACPGALILFTPAGGFSGSVLVVWVGLHVIHAPRAGVSALVRAFLRPH